MPPNERGGLKAAFSNFKKTDPDREAELRLLGRAAAEGAQPAHSYQVATNSLPNSTGLVPRPLLQREAVRQLSFRCPITVAMELKRKAAFNQLEQQEILIEAVKRVLQELPEPPEGWEG